MNHVTRDRRLTLEEAAEYKRVREQIVEELPNLISQHHARMEAVDHFKELSLPDLLQSPKSAQSA